METIGIASRADWNSGCPLNGIILTNRELKSVTAPSKKKKKSKEIESDSEGDEEGDNTDEESLDDKGA